MIKRGLSILLIIAVVMTMGAGGSYADTEQAAVNSDNSAVGTSSSEPFSDIKGHWAESIIREAAALKIVGGYPDGTYLPENLIKREEFFKLLTNILTEKPDTSNTAIPFSDVVDYEWYVPTIKTAVAAGITSGYGDGTFGIGLMISRQEAAKVVGSVISSTGTENGASVDTVLDKSKIADWAYQYVDLMFKKGYMRGDTEGNFRPTSALTRAEAATILLSIKKNEPVIAANASELTATDCMLVHQGLAGIFAKGSGSKSDPYEISNEAQLNHLRMHAQESAYYIVTKNIAITEDYAVTPPAVTSDDPDWTGGNFEPIGSKENPFKGNLDGNGYSISGLNISGSVGKGSDKTAASYTGLFGCLAPGSGVTDLIVDTSTIAGNQYTGAIAGYSQGTVSDCQLGKKGIVSGELYTGGLVGYSTKPLTSLENMGAVTGARAFTGGIVGAIDVSGTALADCKNDGTVTGNEKTGGIVGEFTSSQTAPAAIKNCINSGTVNAGDYNGGGIAGIASGKGFSVSIENCGNTGNVTGSAVNGGIAGFVETGKASIIKSKNTGEVYGSGAGGIAGTNQGVITGCYNSGSVKAALDAGGIAANQQNSEGRITRSYNEGAVNAKSNAGGIIGENDSKVDNCYHSGKVSGTSSVGGIAGKNTGTVTNVYCAGTVSGGSVMGALIGRNAGALSNSYWLEAVGSAAVGISDSAAKVSLNAMVTKEELSGQVKIKTSNGYAMLIDIMNSNAAGSDTSAAPVWEYLYEVLESASGGDTVVSDGGGIVPPITTSATDSTGNTIDPEDLLTKYLFPSIVK